MSNQLISSQIHNLHGTCGKQTDISDKKKKSNSLPLMSHRAATDAKQHRRSTSNLSDAGGQFFSQFSSKYSSHLIDKFIRSELLNSSYDSQKCQSGYSTPLYSNQVSDLRGFDSLQGSYRNHGDGKIYEIVQVKHPGSKYSNEEQTSCKTIHHQKVKERSPQPTLDTHTSDNYPAHRGRGVGFRSQKQSIAPNLDNNLQSSRCIHSSGSGSVIQRSSSGSSSSGTASSGCGGAKTLTTMPTPERLQRRRLLHMIFGYDLQNKQLQRELAREKRRRTEELACVVKSLVLFEAKLKNDLKSVNQRMLDRDAEICRLTRLTRTLRKRLKDQQRNKGMAADQWAYGDKCLVLEPLQCNNCRKQFDDIDISASGCEPSMDENAEPCSSSDDTLSSSFCGARRSVRYTSKRTAGTFIDYMRSRAMQIDPAVEQHSEENTSSVSLEDSQTSYEQLPNYARAIERMHSVKMSPENFEYSQQSNLQVDQGKTTDSSLVTVHLREDDGIFSLTQKDDDDYELNRDQEQKTLSKGIKMVQQRFADFSEASPKQIYEATTDDWYASASDQEESSTAAAKPYAYRAGNPVLECVNQILLQQSMEETRGSLAPKSALASRSISNANLAQRSHLGGRSISNGRKRVHFSTKNSMVHVPRHDDREAQVRRQIQISDYQLMAAANALNYGSIYSNEYEPIGSERASNHYVEMAATAAINSVEESADPGVLNPSMKFPPALPPKPANLLKFQKSLPQVGKGQQVDVNVDCGASITTASEPDYCSISEVGLTRTCVQIVVDVHKAPESNSPPTVEHQEQLKKQVKINEMEAIINPLDDNHSEKTNEIEGIFADIPKLPNVAAIIAPKQSDSDSLIIKPKGLQMISQAPPHPQCLSLSTFQYKRKHVPNIVAEINKRMSLPNFPTTPKCLASISVSKSVPRTMTDPSREMPIHSEFDWYNLDAEYDRSQKVGKHPDAPTTADEYNLDEEFQQEDHPQLDPKVEDIANALGQSHLEPATANQMFLNLANFEKFIEGSGISTKPLPCKRKIFFNAPIV